MPPTQKHDDGKTFQGAKTRRLPSKHEYAAKGYALENYDAMVAQQTEEAAKSNQTIAIDAEPTATVLVPPAPASELRFPKQPKDVKGTPDAARVSNWATQYHSGLLTKCNVKGDGQQCYYPLTFLRDPRRDNQPKIVTGEDGRQGYAGRCSFDPEGHGEQVIYPPKKDDEV